jgi:hypothetical protein
MLLALAVGCLCFARFETGDCGIQFGLFAAVGLNCEVGGNAGSGHEGDGYHGNKCRFDPVAATPADNSFGSTHRPSGYWLPGEESPQVIGQGMGGLVTILRAFL